MLNRKLDVIIRSAKLDDLVQLVQLDHEYYLERRAMVRDEFQVLESPTAADVLKTRIREDHFRMFVAEADGKIIGYLIGKCQETIVSSENQKEGRVCDVFVCKKSRRLGIATQLYARARQWFIECGCQGEGLTVYAANSAKNLYERWGYVPYSINMRKLL